MVQHKRLCRLGGFQEPGSEEKLGFSGSQMFCGFHTEQWRPGEICLMLTHFCPDVSEGMREVGKAQTDVVTVHDLQQSSRCWSSLEMSLLSGGLVRVAVPKLACLVVSTGGWGIRQTPGQLQVDVLPTEPLTHNSCLRFSALIILHSQICQPQQPCKLWTLSYSQTEGCLLGVLFTLANK